MKKIDYQELFSYVSNNIVSPFYELRLKRLNELKLNTVIKRKNPYLLKAKNITTAQDFVVDILQAHLSSQEETLFGKYLEELAIFICYKIFGGFKSSAEGIDLEFEKENKRYIVTIKSGPNWGNSTQISKMFLNFRRAKKVLGANSSITNIVAVNGCCYGRDNHPDKGEYLKLCGQEFWFFISGDDHLYLKIIEPLDKKAKQKDEIFKEAYNKKVNILTSEFLNQFCFKGNIDWENLLRFVSQKNKSV
ncbi:cytosolic protein [Candidatus Gottesmanbacteria bacterium]|nr:cytosolic protein [Candidatus Gottesmanbacteria bacterium]